MARVSIVLPTYQRAHIIGRAIDSVRRQRFEDWELLVVDDGSTDGTRDVVEAYRDARIKYIERPERGGGAAARNTGIEAATGSIIAFQDSDDAWTPGMLRRQVRRMDRGERVVYCSFWRHLGRSRLLRPRLFERPKSGDMLPTLLYRNPVTTAATTIERDLLLDVGCFDADIPRFHDWDLWIRLAEQTRFEHIGWPGMHQYPQPDSISHDTAATVAAHRHILAKYAALFEAHPPAHVERLLLLAQALRRDGQDPARTIEEALALGPEGKLRRALESA